jgi:hypothetical protein
METTLQMIERIESHDDVWKHSESQLSAILYRGLPHIFHNYLGKWPTVKANIDWDIYLKHKGEAFVYYLMIRYKHWVVEDKFDATIYTTETLSVKDWKSLRSGYQNDSKRSNATAIPGGANDRNAGTRDTSLNVGSNPTPTSCTISQRF